MRVSRIISAIAGTAVLVYMADWAVFARRSSGANGNALGSVTYYYASATKSGRAEVYFDQPQTEVCAHSLFPHSGYSPCWYSNRKSNIRTIN
jgi:hypothetical protein